MTLDRDRLTNSDPADAGKGGGGVAAGRRARTDSIPPRPTSMLPPGSDVDMEAYAAREREAADGALDAFGVHLETRADSGGGGVPPVKRPSRMNAALKVTAYGADGKVIKSWSSPAIWKDKLPVVAEGTRKGSSWSWNYHALVNVNTDERGAGGQSAEAWGTKLGAARLVIHIADINDVTQLELLDLSDVRGMERGKFEEGSDLLGDALPEDAAGAGGKGKVGKDEAKPGGERKGKGGETPEETGTGTGDERREGQESDVELEGVEDESFGDDPESEQLAAEFEKSIGIFEGEADDVPGGETYGREGDDTSADGKGKGGDHFMRGGGEKSRGRSEDGVDVARDDTPGGQKTGEEGAVGGEDGGRKGGVRGGGGIALFFGFTIAIPESLVGAVEVALIVESGHIGSFGPKVLSKGTRKFASSATTRKALASEVRKEAAERMRKLQKVLADAKKKPPKGLTAHEKKLLKEWSELSAEERKRAMRVTYWEMQRQMFDSTLKASQKEAKQLRRSIAKAKNPAKRAELEQRLAYVEKVEEAASIQPIAGRLPINHELAGKDFPRELLPKKYQADGLRFTEHGFPDFEPHAFTLPNGKKYVEIEYTGTREGDFAAATRAAGLRRKPEDYVWHHHEETGKMMLIPEDLHKAVKHTGGVAGHKHATGIAKYGE